MLVFCSFLSGFITEGGKGTQSFPFCTGTRIRTQIKGFGDLYSTIELCPFLRNKVPRGSPGTLLLI